MEETRPRAYGLWDVAIYLSSVVAIVTFILHFWWITTNVSLALWFVAAAFAVFSIYGGVIERSRVEQSGTRKGRSTAAAIIGVVVLIGLTWSATLLLVPLNIAYG